MEEAAVSAFAALGVSPKVAGALTERGYETPTKVQEALLAAEAGRDILVSSQTGSGKTVAFGLVLAPRFEEPASEEGTAVEGCAPRAVVIAPTRELAAQVREELAWLLRPLGVRILAVTGGTSVGGELRSLARGADILVATPGRLCDHLSRGSVVCDRVQVLVLDEADEMLDMGFRDELETILQGMPEARQTIMLSATLPPAILSLAQRYVRDAVRIASDPPGASNANIAHVAHVVVAAQRLDALINVLLMAPDDRTLVFVRTRAEAADMANALAGLGFGAAALTGEMAQRERAATLDAFRAGRVTILVATDVAARGIDVPDVGRVVHADIPGDASTLTHRAGRTGRAGRKGTSVLLVKPFERGRAQEMLRAAGAKATWRPAPTDADIRTTAEQRLRERVLREDQDAPDDARTALATSLLADADATVLIARLLGLVSYMGPCAPRVVTAPAVREPKAMGRSPMGRAEGGERHGRHVGAPARVHHDGPTSPRPPVRHEGERAFFKVNFGTRDGATPARLLAIVCRRGGVRGGDVGMIRVGPSASTFCVPQDMAETFATSAGRHDPREPQLRIEPAAMTADRPQPRPARSAPWKSGTRPVRAVRSKWVEG